VLNISQGKRSVSFDTLNGVVDLYQGSICEIFDVGVGFWSIED